MTGKRQLTVNYAKKIEDKLGVGVDWLLFGDEDAKEYPYGYAMIEYLKKHPEVRKEIWDKMKTENTTEKHTEE